MQKSEGQAINSKKSSPKTKEVDEGKSIVGQKRVALVDIKEIDFITSEQKRPKLEDLKELQQDAVHKWKQYVEAE